MASDFNVSECSDAELVVRLERMVCADRALSAQLIVHLGEVEERGLYRERGYSSMYEYCVSALRMSDAEAYFRLHAARLARRFPMIVELLAAGDLNLTSINLLSGHLTEENCVQLIERARGKTKAQVKALLAEVAPQADVPARIRKLPSAPASKPRAPSAVGGLFNTVADTPSPVAVQPPKARACTAPLSPGRFKLELTLGQEAHDKLEQLRELLRHQNPGGDLVSIIERAISELLEREMKRRFAQTDAPARRPAVRKKRNTKSRYIPRNVVREVYARDEGQCTFVSSDGHRCSARSFLELHHHETTHARGGEPTPDNLRLACRAHNALFAERDYGRSTCRTSCDKSCSKSTRSRNESKFDPSAQHSRCCAVWIN